MAQLNKEIRHVGKSLEEKKEKKMGPTWQCCLFTDLKQHVASD